MESTSAWIFISSKLFINSKLNLIFLYSRYFKEKEDYILS